LLFSLIRWLQTGEFSLVKTGARMNPQLNLFSYPAQAGYKAPGPSREAAEAIEATGKAETLRQKVMALFQSGFTGTAHEVADRLGENFMATSPRISELKLRGLLTETGERRKNPGGRLASVWRIA